LQFGFVSFWRKIIGAKAAGKMLVKLTQGVTLSFVSFFSLLLVLLLFLPELSVWSVCFSLSSLCIFCVSGSQSVVSEIFSGVVSK